MCQIYEKIYFDQHSDMSHYNLRLCIAYWILCICCNDTPALGQLVAVSECTCPGKELRLECTVVGGFSTLWRGTAFDCIGQSNQIQLNHARFGSGTATGVCNNGIIIGRNINRTFDGTNSIFTSQLTINLPLLNDTSNTLDGRTVQCAHSMSDTIDVVGIHTIAYTRVLNSRSMNGALYNDTIMIVQFEYYDYTAAPPAPDNVHLAQVAKNALTFQWEPVQFICSYKVNAEGCGMCPNTTLHASVTCVVKVNDILTNSASKNFVCNLSISTTACGFQSESSETAMAILRGTSKKL